ncbi:zinc finger MYM-type protein 1-like protein [Tanacetum coccineum]
MLLKIQRILHRIKVQEAIRDEIGNAKFCLIVDESQDESRKEQMAICLQLALVAASKYVSEVHTFFKHLKLIVNVIGSYTKWNDQLQDAQIDEIPHLTEIGELKGGRGVNQMQNLQRDGDTR